jgi:hypothetical protein
MSRTHIVIVALLVAVAGLAIAQQSRDPKPAAAQPQAQQMQLPPGWTEADMQACMAACTPGKMHEQLAKGVGVWKGTNTMWMYPGAEPVKTPCTSTVTSFMDGRFVKIEMAGEMPGMGPFNGFGINGYDNVAQKFVSTWLDNCGTGILSGTGELSPDGKTMTWSYSYTCPVTKKPTAMRQVETTTGPNTMTLDVYTTDPKAGKEYKMISIDFTKS